MDVYMYGVLWWATNNYIHMIINNYYYCHMIINNYYYCHMIINNDVIFYVILKQ